MGEHNWNEQTGSLRFSDWSVTEGCSNDRVVRKLGSVFVKVIFAVAFISSSSSWNEARWPFGIEPCKVVWFSQNRLYWILFRQISFGAIVPAGFCKGEDFSPQCVQHNPELSLQCNVPSTVLFAVQQQDKWHWRWVNYSLGLIITAPCNSVQSQL